MNAPPFDKDKANRWFAVELNNRSWDLLEKPELTEAEADEVVHAAHASVYHWRQVGTVANHARALCLLANVYAALRRGGEAIRYARQCVELAEAHAGEIADWDLAFGYDCLARATAAAGDREAAAKVRQQARDYGDKIAEAEDKAVFDSWFASGKWHGIG